MTKTDRSIAHLNERAYHHSIIMNTRELAETVRAGCRTDLGGYPIFFITSDGAALSFESVVENYALVFDSVYNDIDDGWKVEACAINWEDNDLYCDHSNEKIEPAYTAD